MKILLTGFEPFNNNSSNPSEQVVQILKAEKIRGVELETALLLVDRHCGPSALLKTVETARPDIELLSANHWLAQLIQQAETLRGLMPAALLDYYRQTGI